VTKCFKVKGEKRFVELYKRRMPLKELSKPQNRSCRWKKPKWRGVAKIKNARHHILFMHTSVAITAHKIGRPELANNIAAFNTKKPEKRPNTKTTQNNYLTLMRTLKLSSLVHNSLHRKFFMLKRPLTL
jgi:hypothetical protein